MEESQLVSEDEYDELNDETFGNDGAEYNWEANQDLLGTLLEGNYANGAKPTAAANRQDAENGREIEDLTAFDSDLEHYNFENENALEESISRLVLDEIDDDNDEEASTRLRRMTSTNSYAYFMPPQWFMDKEYPGDSSLLGSSVWSMQPTTVGATSVVPSEKSHVSTSMNNVTGHHRGVNQLSDILAKGDSDANRRIPQPDLSALLSGVRGLDNAASVVQPSKPPTFKTVDEIEQEMLRESETMISKPPETVAELVNKNQTSKPKIISVEDLEREFIRESPAPAATQLEKQAGRQETHLVSDMLHPRKGQPGVMLPHPGQLQMVPNNQLQFIRHPLVQRPQARNAAFPQLFPHGIPGIGPQQMPIHPLRLHQQQQFLQQRLMQQHISANQMRAAFRPPFPLPVNQRQNGPFGNTFVMNPFPNFMVPPRQMHPMHMPRPVFEHKDGGLMTEKDKQRLKNIQIVQLQNDHPHTTDYYCLMRKVRVGAKGCSPLDLLRLLFPKKSDDDNGKRLYEPAHFENSLGKLQAQSALAPKKAIDTVIRVADAGPVGGKKKCYRYLLLEIEKLYECLLMLEEVDLRTVVATSNKNSPMEDIEIRLIKQRVENLLTDYSKMKGVLSVRKGKFLVCRLAALAENNIRMVALLHLLKEFPTWAISSPNHGDAKNDLIELYPYLKHCILNMDIVAMEALCRVIEKELIETWLSTKLGSSIIMVLLHQGELLSCNMQLTDQFKRLWCQLSVVPIVETLLVAKASVVPPAEIFQVGCHRLLACDFLLESTKMELKLLWESFLSRDTKVIKS